MSEKELKQEMKDFILVPQLRSVDSGRNNGAVTGVECEGHATADPPPQPASPKRLGKGWRGEGGSGTEQET